MFGAIIEIVVGWLVTYKVCEIVGAKGFFATVIKLIGIVFLIAGCVSLARCFISF
ncbi:MAG: hypothetical protein KBT33_11110 [Prevotellaceae bacterium]|nr:hypothetical protein [Candidatus Minthosoma equi]